MDVCAVIAGDASDRRYVDALQAQAVARGIASHVYFIGHVGGDLKVSLLQAASLTVVPTSQENFGFVFYESLAAGTPVVTTDLVDTADELARSGAGYIVKQSSDAIAECVRRVLTVPGERATAGQRGRTWVFNELATSRVAEKYERMFGDAIASAHRNRA
jgi:glycosyltransferase involved in cell wall biosynthesis